MDGMRAWTIACAMAGSCLATLNAATQAAAAAPADCDGPASQAVSTEVASVAPRLDLRLADGRLVRLVGLDPALDTPDDPDGAERARTRLASLLGGKPVTLDLLATKTDRWGRLPARAFLGGRGDEPDLVTMAIAAGLGRYLAEPAAHACRGRLVAAETAARDAKLGLWADPYYAVLAVDDRAGFTERSGTIVVVEGRLAAVSPGAFRTKLRFATTDRSGRALNAVILPRQMKIFEGQRVDFSALIGRTLRLRGLLDQRFGPQIELAGPDDLEILDASVATGAK